MQARGVSVLYYANQGCPKSMQYIPSKYIQFCSAPYINFIFFIIVHVKHQRNVMTHDSVTQFVAVFDSIQCCYLRKCRTPCAATRYHDVCTLHIILFPCCVQVLRRPCQAPDKYSFKWWVACGRLSSDN